MSPWHVAVRRVQNGVLVSVEGWRLPREPQRRLLEGLFWILGFAPPEAPKDGPPRYIIRYEEARPRGGCW